MIRLLTILLLISATTKGQYIVQTLDDLRGIGAAVQDTIPMKVTYRKPSGVIRTVSGYGVLVSDTNMNRLHDVPEVDSLPHYVKPGYFLDRRKRLITGEIIHFENIFKY